MRFLIREFDQTRDLVDAVVATVLEADLSHGVALTGGRVGTDVSLALVDALTSTSAGAALTDLRLPIRLWFSDERFLAQGDTQRNDTAVRERIAHHANVHLESALGPDKCSSATASAADYQARLTHIGVPQVAVVSVGPDGHVASVFPGHRLMNENSAGVKAVTDSPKPPPERITWTLPLLQQVERLLVLAAGDEKRETVERMLAGDSTIPATALLGPQTTLFIA